MGRHTWYCSCVLRRLADGEGAMLLWLVVLDLHRFWLLGQSNAATLEVRYMAGAMLPVSRQSSWRNFFVSATHLKT